MPAAIKGANVGSVAVARGSPGTSLYVDVRAQSAFKSRFSRAAAFHFTKPASV